MLAEFNLEAQQPGKSEKRKRPKIRRESGAGARATKVNTSSTKGLDSTKELGSSPEFGAEDPIAEEDFSSEKREFEADLESEVEKATDDSSTAESNSLMGDAEIDPEQNKISKSKISVVAAETMKILRTTEGEQVTDFCNSYSRLKQTGLRQRAIDLILPALIPSIKQRMMAEGKQNLARDIRTIKSDVLLKFLERAYPEKSGNRTSTIEEQFRQVNFQKFDPEDPSSADRLVNFINNIHEKFPECHGDVYQQETLSKQLLNQVGDSTAPRRLLHRWLCRNDTPLTVELFNVKLLRVAKRLAEAIGIAKDAGYVLQRDNQGSYKKKRTEDFSDEGDRSSKRKKERKENFGDKKKNDFKHCDICGRNFHSDDKCRFKNLGEELINRSTQPWKQSSMGKKWLEFGYHVFPEDEKIHKEFLASNRADTKSADYKIPRKGKKGEEIACCLECNTLNLLSNPINNIESRNDSKADNSDLNNKNTDLLSKLKPFSSNDDYTISATVITLKNDLPIRFLLDIGALQDNYISVDLANALEAAGIQRLQCNQKVCSALNNICKVAHGKMCFVIEYYNVYENKKERLNISAKVLDINFDLIIGLPTIKINNLITKKFAYKFSSGVIPIGGNLVNKIPTYEVATNKVESNVSNSAKLLITSGIAHNAHPNGVIASLVEELRRSRINKSEILHSDLDDNGIEDNHSQEPWNETPLPKESDELDLVYVEGNDQGK